MYTSLCFLKRNLRTTIPNIKLYAYLALVHQKLKYARQFGALTLLNNAINMRWFRMGMSIIVTPVALQT